MADERIHQLFRELYTRRIDRRTFVTRASALGISSAAVTIDLANGDYAKQITASTAGFERKPRYSERGTEMECDSKERGNRSSARSHLQGRQSALHRQDPRRPRHARGCAMNRPYQLAFREKPR